MKSSVVYVRAAFRQLSGDTRGRRGFAAVVSTTRERYRMNLHGYLENIYIFFILIFFVAFFRIQTSRLSVTRLKIIVAWKELLLQRNNYVGCHSSK